VPPCLDIKTIAGPNSEKFQSGILFYMLERIPVIQDNGGVCEVSTSIVVLWSSYFVIGRQ
jgi:hypothetical protein